MRPFSFMISQRCGYSFSECETRLVEFLGNLQRFPKDASQRFISRKGKKGPKARHARATVNLGHMWHEVPKIETWMKVLVDGVNAGWVRPHVDRTFPLAQAGDAQAYIELRRNTGKVILIT
ncbi:MAG: zinc-binding dehydrogenase [Steroidobacteraceae bacterium]